MAATRSAVDGPTEPSSLVVLLPRRKWRLTNVPGESPARSIGPFIQRASPSFWGTRSESNPIDDTRHTTSGIPLLEGVQLLEDLLQDGEGRGRNDDDNESYNQCSADAPAMPAQASWLLPSEARAAVTMTPACAFEYVIPILLGEMVRPRRALVALRPLVLRGAS
jgi:hypothetical protein